MRLQDPGQEATATTEASDAEASQSLLAERLARCNWSEKRDRYAAEMGSVHVLRDAPSPRISVVVVSWVFHPDIVKNLQALASGRLNDFELVFVNNGLAREAYASLEPHINVLVRLKRNTGAYLSRNIGTVFTKAPIILFLDDDGIAAPDLLERHVEAYERYQIISARGICRPKVARGDISPPAQYYLGRHPFPRFADMEGNASYLADSFFAVKGWDDDIWFGHGGRELAYRLAQREPRIERQIYLPDAAIAHDFATDEAHLARKLELQKKSLARLEAKYPGFSASFHRWHRLRNRPYTLPHRRVSPVLRVMKVLDFVVYELVMLPLRALKRHITGRWPFTLRPQ